MCGVVVVRLLLLLLLLTRLSPALLLLPPTQAGQDAAGAALRLLPYLEHCGELGWVAEGRGQESRLP